jgi:hypothetical protein
MKSLLTIIVSFAICMVAKAQLMQDVLYAPSQAYFTDYNTLLTLASPNTNSVGSSFRIDGSLYHSIHAYSTNAFSFALDKSMDGTNWVYGVTNAVAANIPVEVTLVQKIGYIRARTIASTNIVGQINYLGGR